MLKVRVSDEELAAIRREAARLGVTVQRLLVESALAGRAHTATERHAQQDELSSVRRLVAAVGNNVNQLARVANATGRLPAQSAAALEAVARVMARLDAALRAMGGPGA